MNNDTLKLTIENHFTKLLNSHMAKSLMLNHSLSVEAIGFSAWEGRHLCAVITPWFMSLFLVSDDNDDSLKIGSTRTHRFANGSLNFTVAKDELLGDYETCVLFNSVAEFSSQSQARNVALETIRLLLGQEKIRTSREVSAENPENPNRRNLFRLASRKGKNP